jgi:hypothetical protein
MDFTDRKAVSLHTASNGSGISCTNTAYTLEANPSSCI